MEDFKIDTMGTYHGLTLKSVTEGVANKQTNVQHDHVKQPGILSVFSFHGYCFIAQSIIHHLLLSNSRYNQLLRNQEYQ